MTSGKGSTAGIDSREKHRLVERQRRKSMQELFVSLHDLLPHAEVVRKEQSVILEEVIKYIPLAAARLHTLKGGQKDVSSAAPPSKPSSPPAVLVADSTFSNSTDYDIRVVPEPSASVVIRVRGEGVNVSLTRTKDSSQALLMSGVLDELEAYHLELLRWIHCRDGIKMLNHIECKIRDGLERSPTLMKAKLQELACKLHKLIRSSLLK